MYSETNPKSVKLMHIKILVLVITLLAGRLTYYDAYHLSKYIWNKIEGNIESNVLSSKWDLIMSYAATA
jgi:hypothetical protein